MPTIVSISSGKGGVGKTLSTIHMATAIQKNSLNVLVIDADMGLANIDVIMGLQTKGSLYEVIEGILGVEDILLSTSSGFKLIPSGSGIAKIANLNPLQREILSGHLKEVMSDFDVVLLDTGAGISDQVTHYASLANTKIVVTTPEPHAMTDAYAFIKVMHEKYGVQDFKLLVNQTRSEDEGSRVFRRIATVARQFLEVNVEALAFIPFDQHLQHAILRRDLSSQHSLNTISGQSWSKAANKVLDLVRNEESSLQEDYSFADNLVSIPA